jgi:hypothetical protein
MGGLLQYTPVVPRFFSKLSKKRMSYRHYKYTLPHFFHICLYNGHLYYKAIQDASCRAFDLLGSHSFLYARKSKRLLNAKAVS